MSPFCYKVGETVFWDKVSAAAEPNSAMTFHYHDEGFAAQDWFACPQESLDTLYARRAQQIRDQFDYIIICYSGGVDSQNMLDTFAANGIFVDEILMTGTMGEDAEYGSDEHVNGDLYHNAYPHLEALNLRRTTITIEDYSTMIHTPSSWSMFGDEQWFNKINAYYSLRFWYWHDLYPRIAVRDHGRTAVVFGSDKPHVSFDDEGAYVYFNDVGTIAYGVDCRQGGEFGDTRIVNFYSEPDAHDIIVKQANIIRHKQATMLKPRHLQNAEVNELCYPNVHLAFESKKAVSTMLSPRDRWIRRYRGNPLVEQFIGGVAKLMSNEKLKHPANSRKYRF